jgi:4-amino-4-deoxy-L-arabinose transferase-like glycosyltransferase
VIWVVTIVAFFSFSQTKEDLYILPIVPAEAALIGVFMAAGFTGSPTRQLRSGAEERAWLGGLRWNMILAGCALLLAGAGVFWLFVQPGRYSLRGMGPMAALLVGSGIAVMAASASRRLFAATAVLCAGLIAGAWVIVLVTLPDFERYKPVRRFAAMIQERASPGAIVGHYRFALPTMVYYLQRPIMEVVDADHLRSTFRSSSDVYFLMPEAEYLAVKDSFPVPTYVLARRPLFDIKPINFLEGDALPEMLLISNRPE